MSGGSRRTGSSIRRQFSLLAALLDADGALVTYADLGDVVGSGGVNDAAVIRGYAQRLRTLGITGIETVEGRGLRLTKLPPDWALETVLTMLDVLRSEGYLLPALPLRRAS